MRLKLWAKNAPLVLGPAIAFVASWQIIAEKSQKTTFLFGQPIIAAQILWSRLMNGILLNDIAATVFPMLGGFVLGNVLGIVFGLLLWRFKKLNTVARPYLIGFGAVPVFVFAPVLVVWFGTGFEMKVVLVFLSTVLISTLQASTGASQIEPDFFRLLRTYRVKDREIFRHVVLPSASAWVFAGLRLNIGFALLGEFVAEFISSDSGLAHRALFDAGLYNLSAVWASAFVIAVIAVCLYSLIASLEAILVPWKHGEPSREAWDS